MFCTIKTYIAVCASIAEIIDLRSPFKVRKPLRQALKDLERISKFSIVHELLWGPSEHFSFS